MQKRKKSVSVYVTKPTIAYRASLAPSEKKIPCPFREANPGSFDM